MIELGDGFLEMIERRAGPFWSGLLLFAAYLAILGVCIHYALEFLVVPGYHIALSITDWVLHGNFVLPTINSWWDWSRKAFAAIVTLLIGGGATYIGAVFASLLGFFLRMAVKAFASGEFKREFDRLKAERVQQRPTSSVPPRPPEV